MFDDIDAEAMDIYDIDDAIDIDDIDIDSAIVIVDIDNAFDVDIDVDNAIDIDDNDADAHAIDIDDIDDLIDIDDIVVDAIGVYINLIISPICDGGVLATLPRGLEKVHEKTKISHFCLCQHAKISR